MSWKDFELLTAEVAKAFSDNKTTVLSDVQEPSKVGGTRQLDLVVERKISGFGMLRIACEVRDHKAKADITKIDEFYGKLLDLPDINKGVMVNKAGYTKGAKEKAKQYGVGLYTLGETDEIAQVALTYPIVVIEHRITGTEFAFSATAGHLSQLKTQYDGINFTPMQKTVMEYIKLRPPYDAGVHKIELKGFKGPLMGGTNIENPEIVIHIETKLYFGQMGDLPTSHSLRDVINDETKAVLDTDKMLQGLHYRHWPTYDLKINLPKHDSSFTVIGMNPDKEWKSPFPSKIRVS